jgi:hypothetical protein
MERSRVIRYDPFLFRLISSENITAFLPDLLSFFTAISSCHNYKYVTTYP